MKISAFAVDENLELHGSWKDLGAGAAICVARSGNQEYNKMLRAEMANYRSATGITGLTDEVALVISNKILATTILLNWKGLTDDESREVPYSVEKAIEWLTKYKEFKKIVIMASEDIENFRAKNIAETQEAIKK